MVNNSGLRRVRVLLFGVMAMFSFSSCQTLKELSNLRYVKFDIDRVSDAELAGINVERFRNYRDLGVTDALKISQAVAQRALPLEFTLHLGAENPAENTVRARLVRMEWTLLLDDRETVSGLYDTPIELTPGSRQDVPINIRLDLVKFFGNNAQDLVNLALAVAGQNAEQSRIELKATPIIETPIGNIRYPNPITILHKTIDARNTTSSSR